MGDFGGPVIANHSQVERQPNLFSVFSVGFKFKALQDAALSQDLRDPGLTCRIDVQLRFTIIERSNYLFRRVIAENVSQSRINGKERPVGLARILSAFI